MSLVNPFVADIREWKQIAEKSGVLRRAPAAQPAAAQQATGTSLAIEPFKISVKGDVLADLRQRLSRVRLAGDLGNAGWDYGTESGYLAELVRYWEKDFDWSVHEARMNAFKHFRTTIDGVPIHFIHERGQGPNPMPLLLNHGWPWTFWDMRKIIRPLTHPAEFGGDPNDSFDVVVPSLPGFGFSTPLPKTGMSVWKTTDLWARLMEGLGYPRFATQGGDFGAFISAHLGHKYADRVIGSHLTLMVPLDFLTNGLPPPTAYGEDEQESLARTLRFFTEGSAYVNIQSTRPQTLAYAMNDSPAGMCAWFLEKRRAWSDCGGNVEKVFSKDDLLTAMTLYWVTESFGSAARYYYESVHHPWAPSHARTPVVEAPTAVAVFPKEVFQMPRKWAEGYYNLKRWTTFPAGGHFAPMEQPEHLVDDIRAFFRTLRG